MDHRILPRSGTLSFSSYRWSILMYLTFDLSQGPEEKGKEEGKGHKQEVDE